MGPSALLLDPQASGQDGLELGADYHPDHSPFSHNPDSGLCLTLSPPGNCRSLISSSFPLSWLTDPLHSITRSSILSDSEVQSDPSTNLALSPWMTFIAFLACSSSPCWPHALHRLSFMACLSLSTATQALTLAPWPFTLILPPGHWSPVIGDQSLSLHHKHISQLTNPGQSS